jgi:outer membrane lipoprotein carrier protein
MKKAQNSKNPLRFTFSSTFTLFAILVVGVFSQVLYAGAKDKPQVETKNIKPPITESVPTVEQKAAEASVNQNLPKLLQEVEKKYKAAGTLSAKFEQTNLVKAFNREQKSSGVIWVKPPGQFRWQTYQPDPNLLVSDGKRFWFYTPPFDEGERGQVIIRESTEVQPQLATTLLSGSFSMADELTVEEKEDSRFNLIPKPGTAGDIARAEIQVDPKKKIIKEVFLEHHSGNTSRIVLNEIQLGVKAEDQLFRFQAPKNTDVIRE